MTTMKYFALARRLFIIASALLISFRVHAQQSSEKLTTVVLDSAPKKLYTELYGDTVGNQFLVEIYEEPRENENLVHFRAFKNGELVARKSQALAGSHNFSFYIDESAEIMIPPDVRQILSEMLRRLFEESDEKERKMISELFKDEDLARNISKNLELPNADVDEGALATLLSGSIKVPTPQVDDEELANRLSKSIKVPTPQVDDEELANRLSKQIKFDEGNLQDVMVTVMTKQEVTDELSGKIVPRVDENALAKQLSDSIKPVVDDKELARRLSGKIRPSPLDEDALAAELARKLTEKEMVKALKIPKFEELIKNVENANIEKDYDKTIRLLDEDIANRTPAEQHKALKISGLMNLLVASKKLKTAISTIANYDLPEDQLLLQLSKSLESWIQKNLIVE